MSQNNLVNNPFWAETDLPLIALKGLRAGYIQVSTLKPATQYQALEPCLFKAAHQWCCSLERLGAKRVYWTTLSEQVQQLHIHLYPRWTDDEERGLALFNIREYSPQPQWTAKLESELVYWAESFAVYLK
jgi:hypothetical protein